MNTIISSSGFHTYRDVHSPPKQADYAFLQKKPEKFSEYLLI